MSSDARRKIAAALGVEPAREKVGAHSVLHASAQDIEYQRAILRAQLDVLERQERAGRRREHALINPDPVTVRGIVRAARQGPETPYDAHLRLVGSDPDLGAIARSLTAPAVMFSDAYYGDSAEDQQTRQKILAVLQALNGD